MSGVSVGWVKKVESSDWSDIRGARCAEELMREFPVDSETLVSVDDLCRSSCDCDPDREDAPRAKLRVEPADGLPSRIGSSKVTGRDTGSDFESCMLGGGGGAFSSSTRSTLAGGDGGGGPK